MRRVSHYLRTLFAFVFFGVGGGFLSFVVMPLIWLGTLDRERATQRCQRTLQRGFRLFFRVLAGLRLLKTQWPLAESITPCEPSVIVCTHPCLLDTVAMSIRYSNTICLVKQSYYDNPLFRWLAILCGFIPAGVPGSVHAHRRALDAAVDRLRRGYSVLAFPEGRRTPIDGRLRFGRGPFEIAARAGVPLVPVRLQCTPRTLAREIPLRTMPLECVLHSAEEFPPVVVEAGRAGTRAATQGIQDLLQLPLGEPASSTRDAQRPERVIHEAPQVS